MDQGILEGATMFKTLNTKLLPRENIDRSRVVDLTLGSGRIRREGRGGLDLSSNVGCRGNIRRW